MRCPKNLSQPRQPQVWQLSWCDQCFNPSVMVVALHWTGSSYFHVLFVLGSPELDPGLQLCLVFAEQKARIISFDLLETLFIMQLILE